MLSSCGLVRAGVLLASVLLLIGCGGKIDSGEVYEGKAYDGVPTKFKEGGELVTGTVVTKNEKGDVIKEVEYVDGFPQGMERSWYENGQLKSEEDNLYWEENGRHHTSTKGTSRHWCENGTLKSESTNDDKGRNLAGSKRQTWTCSGKLLQVVTEGGGEFMIARELENGEVVTTEQGVRLADGKFDGVHKQFSNDVRFIGKPVLEENWKNGELDGSFKKWSAMDGSPEEEGTYAAGKKVGTWKRWLNGYEMVIDYDVNNFVNPQYAGAFMQAAGIPPRYGSNQPLQEYRTDPEKLRYYVKEGLVDPKKKLDLGGMPAGDNFSSQTWTYAYVHAAPSALEVLAEIGADPKAIDSMERSRLHYCVISIARNGCSPEELQRLIGLGIAIDQPDEQGITPLMELMRHSMGGYGGGPPAEIVAATAKMLMDAGASPDAKARDGWTPLGMAVLYKHFDLAGEMLEKTKEPTATTQEGLNLVHLAFLTPDKSQFSLRLDDKVKAFVQAAVAKGVDPNQKAGANPTMKEIALQAGAVDVAQFLTSLAKS